MKIIDNFLPKEIFTKIQDFMLGPAMLWHYQKHTTAESIEKNDFYFTHTFYADKQQQSDFFEEIIHPILGRLDFNHLLRARGRLITRQHKQIPHNFHTDDPRKHAVALFSINTNNGHTLFEDGTKQFSVENTLLLFDGSLKHATVPQTDSNIRVNINLNFI